MLQSATRGVPVLGGCLLPGCLLPGGSALGGAWSRGVSALEEGLLPGGWSVLGGSAPGGSALGGLGVSGLGGCLCSRGVSQHALRQTPLPPVDRHTLVKILPWPNFVAAGNKRPATPSPEVGSPSEKSWMRHCTMLAILSSETFLCDNKKLATKFYFQTRMHSSRMRTVRCSSRMPGGVFLGGVHRPLRTEFLTHACENITFP